MLVSVWWCGWSATNVLAATKTLLLYANVSMPAICCLKILCLNFIKRGNISKYVIGNTKTVAFCWTFQPKCMTQWEKGTFRAWSFQYVPTGSLLNSFHQCSLYPLTRFCAQGKPTEATQKMYLNSTFKFFLHWHYNFPVVAKLSSLWVPLFLERGFPKRVGAWLGD